MAMNFGTKLTTTRPAKDNCSLFAPASLFSGARYPMVSFKFLPCRRTIAMATNFGTKLNITLLLQNIIAHCFHLPPIFRPRLCSGVM